jgi:hypothetical protein
VPSVSKKQHNFMAAVAKNPGFAKKVGVPRAVGEEFLTADKGKKFKEGGMMKKKMRKFADGGETSFERGIMAGLARSAPESDLDKLRSDLKSTGRAGMSAGKAAVGSIPMVRGAKELASRLKVPKSYDEEANMKKGGTVKDKMKMVAEKAVKGHEKRMHKMAKGGVTRADGCVTKGHTKGKMISMKSGGYC